LNAEIQSSNNSFPFVKEPLTISMSHRKWKFVHRTPLKTPAIDLRIQESILPSFWLISLNPSEFLLYESTCFFYSLYWNCNTSTESIVIPRKPL